MSDLSPYSNLSPNQLNALEALNTRGKHETLESIANRAGITVRTLHRYLVDPNFDRAYRQRIRAQIGANRQRVADALVKAAIQSGPGQASMQKLFWQLIGDFKESVELSGPDGGPIQVESAPINIESLSEQGKKDILAVLIRERMLAEGGNGGESAGDNPALDVEYRALPDTTISTSDLPMIYNPDGDPTGRD